MSQNDNLTPDPEDPRDKEKLDAQREEAADETAAGAQPDGTEQDDSHGADVEDAFEQIVEGVDVDEAPSKEQQLETMLTERTEDLQRLQAEYVNYKRRVDRDRDLSKRSGIEKVLADLMPVLDSVAMARQHGELEGGFKLVADELEKVSRAHGMESFGEIGDEFDPMLHEALMQMPLEGARVTCVSQVMQPGYRIEDRVLRPARVAVSEPDPHAAQDDSEHADDVASADTAPDESPNDDETKPTD